MGGGPLGALTPTAGLREVLRLALEGGVPRRSFRVALVVGTVLNLINQGDAILGQGTVVWSKLLLTYLVPYCVATYGAVTAKQQMARQGR